MVHLTISKAQARQFVLTYQGLWSKKTLHNKTGIEEYIRRVGCIQFDPLNITGYNHELVLQSRIKDFSSHMLQQLLYEDRKLLDGWDKNMSIYPVEDWPFFNRFRLSERCLMQNNKAVMDVADQIIGSIAKQGPLSSRDLDHNQLIDWSWAPTRLSRAALESLYFCGDLVIHHRVGTRKYYDLTQRHIAQYLLDNPDPNPADADYYAWYVLRRIGSIGLLWNKGGHAWLGISGFKSQIRNEAFVRLLSEECIVPIHIEGLAGEFFLRTQDIPLLEDILSAGKGTSGYRAAFIAPLDNLMWDRKLVQVLFDFDYRWEVYTPAVERKYGYYVLPVLYNDCLIARFEPVRERETRTLILKNWWWEPKIRRGKRMLAALNRTLVEFMNYLEVEHIRIDAANAKGGQFDWLDIRSTTNSV